jgi:hypothetical protein
MPILFILFALISPPRLFDVIPHKALQPQGVELERVHVAFAPVSLIRQMQRGDVVEIPTSVGNEEYEIVRVASFVPGTVSVTALALDGSGDHLALTFDGDIVTGIAQSIRHNRFDVFGSDYRAKVNLADLDHISCGADELHNPSDHLPDEMKKNPIERVPESMRKMLHEAQSTGLDSVTIDLLMVYTPKAEMWADTTKGTSVPGSFSAAVAQAMNLSQQAMDISNLAIKLRMVHLHKTNYDEDSGATSTVHLQRLTARPGDTGWPEGTLGFMDEVHTLRDQYGADLVALLAFVSDTGGLAWRLGSYGGRPQNGFSLNRIQQTHFTYTLVHEIGHNMGNMHGRRPTQTSQAANRFGGLHSYSVGYQWTANSGAGFVTVMHYGSAGFSRTPYFSSTSELVDGVAIGSSLPDSLGADNARSMREIRRTIARYRTTQVAPSDLVLPASLVVNVGRGETRTVELPITNIGAGDAMWSIDRMRRPVAKEVVAQAVQPRALYQTGFETSEGFPLGQHTILNDWRTYNSNVSFLVSNAAPRSGAQHLRWSQTAGLAADRFAFIDSPQFVDPRPGHQTVSFDFRQSNPASRFDVYVYDNYANIMAVGWIVDREGNVFIRPGPSTGTFSFLATAPRGEYHTLFAELDPAAGKIRYRLNDGAFAESDLSGETRFNSLSFVAENPSSAGITVDLDNLNVVLMSPDLPGFVFQKVEGTLRPGASASIPFTVYADELAVGTHEGVVDIRTDSGIRSTRITLNVVNPLSTEDPMDMPESVELDQNFPNPFNPVTVIGFNVGTQDLASLHRVRLSVYDLLGREIAVLVDGVQAAGSHKVSFDASSLASGVYVYQLQANGHVITRKMVLLK